MFVRCLFGLMTASLMGCATLPARTPSGPHASRTSPSPANVPQVCRARHASGAYVTLKMEIFARPHLQRECQRVVDYLALPPAPLPPVAVPQAEAALAKLGYFSTIACDLDTPGELACALVNTPVVRSFSIRGHLPITLLQEDMRRRISLRPGTLLPDLPGALRSQAIRLEAFLRNEGYFDAAVAIVPRKIAGTGLHQDIHLDIDVTAREVAQVRTIRFEGDPTIATQKLARPFWQRGFLGLNNRFRPAGLGDSITAATALLKDQGYFGAHIQASYTHHPEAHAIDLKVRVQPGRRVQVQFISNTAVREGRLRRMMPFAASGAVDAVAVEEMRQSIVRLYQQKGYAEVDVQATIGRADARTIAVTYVIDPQQRYSVSKIVFSAMPHLTPAKIMRQGGLLQRANTRFRDRPWVDAYVDHDEAYLTHLLREQGFAQAVVQAHKQPGSLPNTLVLNYETSEGTGNWVKSAQILGAPQALDLQAAYDHLKLRQGGPFAPGGLDNDVADLEAKLATLGFIQAQVSATLSVPGRSPVHSEQELLEATAPQANGGATTAGQIPIDVIYTIAAGPQAHLGGIFMHGNFRTRSSTMLHEVGVRPGKPLNLSALGTARRSLRSLNLFNAVQLTPAVSSLGAGDTWLVLAVEERDVRSIEAIAAFSSDFRFSVGADLRDANILGRAITLSLTARLANAGNLVWHPLRIGDENKLEAKLRAPHPFGLPFTAEASTLYRYRDVEAYRERRLTGQAALSRPLLRRKLCAYCPDVMGRIGYELTEAYFIDKDDAADLAHLQAQDITIARVVPKLALHRRDSAIDPHRGMAGDITFEVAHPVLAGNLGASATSFWRMLVNVQGFVPLGVPLRFELHPKRTLGGPLVLAVAGSLGNAQAYGRRGGVPPSETFGYGGDLSVRGLTPRASTSQLDTATFMFTASAELRWYVLENLGFGSVQLAGFVDSGTVAQAFNDLYRQHTLSVGPALRYVTPIGPLSLAYGKAVVLPTALQRDPDSAPRHGRLHFTFGYTF